MILIDAYILPIVPVAAPFNIIISLIHFNPFSNVSINCTPNPVIQMPTHTHTHTIHPLTHTQFDSNKRLVNF